MFFMRLNETNNFLTNLNAKELLKQSKPKPFSDSPINKEYRKRELIGTYDNTTKHLKEEKAGVVKIKMYYSGSHLSSCSGTILEQNLTSLILTAAHCANPSDPFIRYVVDPKNSNEVQLYCSPNSAFNFQSYTISTVKEDYAVCATKEPINGPEITPCGFPNTNISRYEQNNAWISGFGITGSDGYCNEYELEGRRSETFKLENKD